MGDESESLAYDRPGKILRSDGPFVHLLIDHGSLRTLDPAIQMDNRFSVPSHIVGLIGSQQQQTNGYPVGFTVAIFIDQRKIETQRGVNDVFIEDGGTFGRIGR